MRYGTETRLSPKEVLAGARVFFGPDSELGLPETATGPDSAVFATTSGGVEISAVATAGKTKVTLLSREYDSWAEKFIRGLR